MTRFVKSLKCEEKMTAVRHHLGSDGKIGNGNAGSAMIYALVTMMILSFFLLDGIRIVTDLGYEQERQTATVPAKNLNESIAFFAAAEIERQLKGYYGIREDKNDVSANPEHRDLDWFKTVSATSLGFTDFEVDLGKEVKYTDTEHLLKKFDLVVDTDPDKTMKLYNHLQKMYYRVDMIGGKPVSVDDQYTVKLQVTSYKKKSDGSVDGKSKQISYKDVTFIEDPAPLFSGLTIGRSPEVFSYEGPKGGIHDNITLNSDLSVVGSAVEFTGGTSSSTATIYGNINLMYVGADAGSLSENYVRAVDPDEKKGYYDRDIDKKQHGGAERRRPAFTKDLDLEIKVGPNGDEARLAHYLNRKGTYEVLDANYLRADDNKRVTFATADYKAFEDYVTDLGGSVTPESAVSDVAKGPDGFLNSEDDGSVIISGKFTIDGAVFYKGDVVISSSGYSGQGVIYSGRNIYIAGDLVAGKAVDWSKGITDDNKDGVSDNLNKPMLGLVARGNIIIGKPEDFGKETFWTDHKFKTDPNKTVLHKAGHDEGYTNRAGSGDWEDRWHDIGYYNDGKALSLADVTTENGGTGYTASKSGSWSGDYSAYDNGVRVGKNPGVPGDPGIFFVKENSTSKWGIETDSGKEIEPYKNSNSSTIILKTMSADKSGHFNNVQDGSTIQMKSWHDQGMDNGSNRGQSDLITVKIDAKPNADGLIREVRLTPAPAANFKFLGNKHYPDDSDSIFNMVTTNSVDRKFYESSISDNILDLKISDAEDIDAFLYTNHMLAINLDDDLTIHGGIYCRDFLSNDSSSNKLTINHDIRIWADKGKKGEKGVFEIKKYLPKVLCRKR